VKEVLRNQLLRQQNNCIKKETLNSRNPHSRRFIKGEVRAKSQKLPLRNPHACRESGLPEQASLFYLNLGKN